MVDIHEERITWRYIQYIAVEATSLKWLRGPFFVYLNP